jgi:hypothetical protein
MLLVCGCLAVQVPVQGWDDIDSCDIYLRPVTVLAQYAPNTVKFRYIRDRRIRECVIYAQCQWLHLSHASSVILSLERLISFVENVLSTRRLTARTSGGFRSSPHSGWCRWLAKSLPRTITHNALGALHRISGTDPVALK